MNRMMDIRKATVSALAVIGSVVSAFANVVVDDTPVTADVTVPAGEELEIRGSGLSATTGISVSLGDGAKVKFYTTATIAAPITSVGGVTFEAADGEVGTVSGKVTSTFTASSQQFVLNAPGSTGKIVFGAMSLGKGGGGFRVKGGTVETTGTVSAAGVSLYMFEGRLVLRKPWSNDNYAGGSLYLNQTQTGDVCLEVAEGGSINYGNNCTMNIGKDANYESKLLLSGGTVYRNIDWHTVYLNNGGTGNGVIEIASGTFAVTGMHCGNKTGTAKIILGNGKWTGNVSNGTTWLVDGVGCTCDIEVTGNFTVDTSSSFRPSVMDFTTCGGTFTFDEGATLKVVSKTDGASELALNNFTGGKIGLDLTTRKAKVNLPDLVAEDDVDLVWALPAAEEAVLAATGASPDLQVTYLMTAGGAVTAPVSASCFEGFGSVVSSGDIAVATADDVVTYFTKTVVDNLEGKLSLRSGTLFLDTDPGDKLENLGGTVRLQDADSFCLGNTSNEPTASGGWTNSTGAASSWVPGAVGVIETRGSNGRLGGVLAAHKLLVGGSGNHYWDGNSGRFEIGAGGLEFTQSKMWGLANYNYIPRIVLAADQVWTNSAASGTAYMQFGFGYQVPNYFKAYLTAAAGVTDWCLGGSFETWLYSPSNDLSDVTVTVSKPAKIRLVKNLDARLNAKELVLDGADMDFGKAFPSGDAYGGSYTSVAAADAAHVAPEVTLKDGGTLTIAKASVPFAIPQLNAVGADNAVTGESIAITQDVTAVSVPAAADALAFDTEIVGEAAFDVAGAGCLSLKVLSTGLSADVAFADGGTLALTGEGDYSGTVTGAGELVIASSGSICLSGSLVGFAGETITVASGTLVLMDAAAIPAGAKVVTEGEGALALVDPTGFDKETMMDGTKNLVDVPGLIITDVPRENEAIEVGDGVTLQVYGSGLKASSTITLAGGAKVIFHRTATVSAPVTANGGVTLIAKDGAVGTFAGAYAAATSSTAAYHDIVGEGLVEFAGGVTLESGNSFRVNGGHALVSSGTMSVKRNVIMLAGDLIFTNATLGCLGSDVSLAMAESGQWGDVKVEFQKGSSWSMGNNQRPSVGYSNEFESRLVLNGGSWATSTSDAFNLCKDGRGIGILEIKAGTFSSNRRITVGNGGTSRIIWSGGTIAGQWNDTNYAYDHLVAGPLTEFLIAGDCVLNLDRMTKSVVSNFNNSAAMMRALPDSSLTVASGGSSRDGGGHWCTNVVFTNFKGDGMKLVMKKSKVNGYPTVEFADATEPIALTRELPANTGDEGGLVKAVGMTDSMLVNYEIPSGITYDPSADYSYWYEGFSSVAVSNLIFKAGSSYRFPIVDSIVTPLAITGKLKLPSALTYLVDATPRPSKIEAATVIEPALGIEGECTWTCGGGLSKRDSCIFAEDGVLKLDYEPKGAVLIVR